MRFPAFRFGITVFCAALTGCGTAEFDDRLDKATIRLQKALKFRYLDGADRPTAIATFPKQANLGTRITFRKPLYFDGLAFAENSADPHDPSKPLDPARLKPPFLPNFPGFRFSYEKTERQSSSSVSYLYVGAQPTEAGVGERILAELKQAFPDAEGLAWTSITCESPDGAHLPWKVLRLDKPQNFLAPGVDATTPIDAAFTLMMYEKEKSGYQVFLGWRHTKTELDRARFAELINAAAGTVAFQNDVPIQ